MVGQVLMTGSKVDFLHRKSSHKIIHGNYYRKLHGDYFQIKFESENCYKFYQISNRFSVKTERFVLYKISYENFYKIRVVESKRSGRVMH